jgi:ribose transport system substrate-binding protein
MSAKDSAVDGRAPRWRLATVLAALALLVVLVAAGCGSNGDDDGTTTAAGAKTAAATTAETADEKIIGYSMPIGAEEGLRAIGYGEEQAIGELDLPWTVKTLDAQLSPDTQVSQLDTFVNLGAAAITSWTLDPGAGDEAYRQATDAGIPVIGFNSESQFISTNVKQGSLGCEAAQEQAEYIADMAPGAKTIVIGGPPLPALVALRDCFIKHAKEAGLKVVARTDDAKSSQQSAMALVTDLVTKHPDVQAVWSFADRTALGASAALTAGGKQIRTSKDGDGVVVVSASTVSEGIDAMRDGQLTATWDPNSPQVGAAAIEVLKCHLVDGTPLEDLPKEITIAPTRWDASNIDQYVKPLERKVSLPAADAAGE